MGDSSPEVGWRAATRLVEAGFQVYPFRSVTRSELATCLAAERLIERGEHLVRRKSPHGTLRLPGLDASRTGPLIGLAQTDSLDEPPQVEAAGGKLVVQYIEDQLALIGVERVEIINRRDQPAAAQVLPDTVHNVRCEVRIRGRRQPLGKYRPRRDAFLELRRGAFQELRIVVAGAFGRGDLGCEAVIHAPGGRCRTSEESRHAPKVILLPAGKRVVVTLCTAQANPQHATSHRLGNAVRRVPDREIECGSA